MGPTPGVFTDPEALIEHLQALGTLTSAETAAMTELDHGLQTAARLSRDWPDDVELQIAGLLHDLAHPWDGRQRGHAGGPGRPAGGRRGGSVRGAPRAAGPGRPAAGRRRRQGTGRR